MSLEIKRRREDRMDYLLRTCRLGLWMGVHIHMST